MNNYLTIKNSKRNLTLNEDLPFHNWYNFVLGYPPHLVQHFINKFNITGSHIVLDPFSGTGTTPIECMKNGIKSIGIEPNDVVLFASQVKSSIFLEPSTLQEYLSFIVYSAKETFSKNSVYDDSKMLFLPTSELKPIQVDADITLTEEQFSLIPQGFISELPLKKFMIIKNIINKIREKHIRNFFLLSLVNITIKYGSNISFGPEIYKSKIETEDFGILSFFVENTMRMIAELESSRNKIFVEPMLIKGDSRYLDKCLQNEFLNQVDFVITSPPYPNEKDYTRSTRLESVLLGFIKSKEELRSLKQNLLRSNSRNVFVNDDDGDFVWHIKEIQIIAEEIERRRIEMNKTSGFEKLYHKIMRHYFGGMYLHLKSLKPFLKKGAKLAYVVGDQASYFQVHIPTASLLTVIAKELGYRNVGIELFRTRLSTRTKKYLDENILILENI